MLENRRRFSRLLWTALLFFVFLAPCAVKANTGVEKWSVETGGNVYSSPVIGSDGTIYVGSDDKKLYAIDPNGPVAPNGAMTAKWSFETGNRIYSSPVVDSNGEGTIYIGSHDFKLYAIRANGTLKWAFSTGNWVESSPAIGSDGTIYVGSWDKKLYAVNPNGTEKWSFETNGYIKSSPVVGPDGTIYVGSDDNHVYAIYPDGSGKWSFLTGNRVRSSAAIASDGTIYIGSDDKKIYAIYPNGTKRWSFSTGGFVYSSPVVGSDGTIYVGSDDKKLYAIRPDGTEKWNVTTGGFVYSSPTIGTDGTVYAGSHDTRLYAIDGTGTVTGTFETGGYVWSSPAVGADGTVYVGCGDHVVYAVTWVADTTPPTVESKNPVHNAVDVGIGTTVTATFSEVMDAATITNSTFLVHNGSHDIAGTVSYGGTIAAFIPDASLAYDTVYTATITSGVRDLAGNVLETPESWSFTTGAYTGPTISVNPTALSQTCQGGQNASNQSFTARNAGGGTLSYTITTDAAWLACLPENGTSAGESDLITISYATAGLAMGVYHASITFSDPNDNTLVAIPVTMTVGNHPPEADAGPDQTVGEGDDVSFNGINSTDQEDGIVSYSWEQIGGSPSVALIGADKAGATFTAPDIVAGGTALTIRLTVTDREGLQDTDTCIVNITGDNDPPTANAGPDQTVGEGDEVSLNGTNSTDPEDEILSYHWVQVSGDIQIILTGADAADANFAAPEAGVSGVSLTFELTVTDAGGLQDTDRCIVNIKGDNDPPTAKAGPDHAVSEGGQVLLNGINSIDPEGNLAKYRWVQTGGSPAVALTNSDTAAATFTTPDTGSDGASLIFELTVEDAGGLRDTDTCIVNITGDNDPPAANAGADQTVYEQNTVQLDGTESTDPDDGIVSYYWEQTGGSPTVTLNGLDTAIPTFIAPDIGPGGTGLTFQLTVSDEGGLRATDTCVINITWTNQAPTAEAGPNQTVYTGDLVYLDATGSTDPDDGIFSYQWEQTAGGPTVTLIGPDTSKPSFTAPDVGGRETALTFQLTVADHGGLQDTDVCTVNVHTQATTSSLDTGGAGSDTGGQGGGGGGGGCFISTMSGLF